MANPRACILSVSGAKLTADERKFIADKNPWGMILMGRSCENPEQVKALTADIWSCLGREALIFIDQEGGRVRRLKPPVWPNYVAPGRYGELYQMDRGAAVEASWLHHRLIAAELEPIGIRADCAPVVDLRHPGKHDIVGDRSFGDTPEQVAELAAAALEGLEAGGVAGVIKHMPGHGRAEVDSHESMPIVRETREELLADIAPFRAVNDAPMGMTAHLAFTAFDGERAATHSETIIHAVIRGQIGFDGLLMTDDLGMKALGGTLAERASKGIMAGCDVALHCSGFLKEPSAILSEMMQVADAAPELSGDALRRAKNAEKATLNKEPFDRAQGWEQLHKLLSRLPPSGTAAA
jgi:beta-N-acetylhexosaminidase